MYSEKLRLKQDVGCWILTYMGYSKYLIDGNVDTFPSEARMQVNN